MAQPRARPAVGAGDARRLGARHGVSGGDVGRAQRPPGPPARHRLLQRLCRRHLRAGRDARGGLRLACAARARAADFRRQDPVLRLALSALLPVHRRAVGADALRAGARPVAGRDARALSRRDMADPALRLAETMRADTARAGRPVVARCCARLPGRVHQHRPWAQRLSHRGADRCGAGDAGPPAAGRWSQACCSA